MSQRLHDNLYKEECAPLLRKPGSRNPAMGILSPPQHSLLISKTLGMAESGRDDRGRERGENPRNLIRGQLTVAALTSPNTTNGKCRLLWLTYHSFFIFIKIKQVTFICSNAIAFIFPNSNLIERQLSLDRCLKVCLLHRDVLRLISCEGKNSTSIHIHSKPLGKCFLL